MNSDSVKIVIIGGGVIGLSIAYHLAKIGQTDVILLERNKLTSGTSWHAVGVIGPLRSSFNLTRLSAYAVELFTTLEAETGQSTGYRRTGGLWLAQSKERLSELQRVAAIGELAGIDAHIITPDEVYNMLPLLRTDDLVGALSVPGDGQANPVDICMAYAKGATLGGIQIREGSEVIGLSVDDGAIRSVETSDGLKIRCDTVVICAGAWSRSVGNLAGVSVPVQAVEHMYVVTEPLPDIPSSIPIVRDLDGEIYIKEDTGRVVLGGFEAAAKVWDAGGPAAGTPFLELPEHWEQFEPFMIAGLNRLPALEKAGIQHFMNGPESFTPDTRQVIGEFPSVKGLFVAAGFNSIGIVSSAGVGRVIADWIFYGEPQTDLWEVDIARFDGASAAPNFLRARVQEAVHDQFAMHWPFKEMETARSVRRSPLHRAFKEAGAFFGAPASWERPLWFAITDDEHELRYSFKDQCWWPAAAREAEATRDRVALYELTPFTKIDVIGPDACSLLQYLCANDIDVPHGRLVYTQMLNKRGGIEADVTVTRLDESAFRVVSGVATRWKDLSWIRRWRDKREARAQIFDATSAETVLGIMGPASRDLLASLSYTDFSSQAFPFSTSKIVDVGMALVRASRVSLVGELGWELYIPNEFAEHVYESLIEAGSSFDLMHAGHFCLNSCRLEKGFRHWGHDIGPDDTPLEAGLGFVVKLSKSGGFIGRDALLRQREIGLQRRSVTFAVEHGHPLLLHDEPIYRDGILVGRTTSGGWGFRVNKSLCLATIALAKKDGDGGIVEGPYEIGVAGARHPLIILEKAAYDPTGARMRS